MTNLNLSGLPLNRLKANANIPLGMYMIEGDDFKSSPNVNSPYEIELYSVIEGAINAGLITIPGGGSGKFVDGTNPLNAVYTTGDVGIGTLVPEQSLHVVGNLKLEGNFNHSLGNGRINVTSSYRFADSANTIIFFISAADHTITANQYGQGTKEAGDLSETLSPYIAAFSTGGKFLELSPNDLQVLNPVTIATTSLSTALSDLNAGSIDTFVGLTDTAPALGTVGQIPEVNIAGTSLVFNSDYSLFDGTTVYQSGNDGFTEVGLVKIYGLDEYAFTFTEDDALLSMRVNRSSTGNRSEVSVSNSRVLINNQITGSNCQLDFNNARATFESTDDKGIQYRGFGESNPDDTGGTAVYTGLPNNALITKKYVDDAISGVGGSSIYSADGTTGGSLRTVTNGAGIRFTDPNHVTDFTQFFNDADNPETGPSGADVYQGIIFSDQAESGFSSMIAAGEDGLHLGTLNDEGSMFISGEDGINLFTSGVQFNLQGSGGALLLNDITTATKGLQLLGFGESNNDDTGETANYSTLVRTSLSPVGYVDDSLSGLSYLTLSDTPVAMGIDDVVPTVNTGMTALEHDTNNILHVATGEDHATILVTATDPGEFDGFVTNAHKTTVIGSQAYQDYSVAINFNNTVDTAVNFTVTVIYANISSKYNFQDYYIEARLNGDPNATTETHSLTQSTFQYTRSTSVGVAETFNFTCKIKARI